MRGKSKPGVGAHAGLTECVLLGGNERHKHSLTNRTVQSDPMHCAATSSRGRPLLALCLEMLGDGPATPEQLRDRVEALIGRRVLITSVRPRMSQAKAEGLVKDSGVRGLAEGGGYRSTVWRLTTDAERQLSKQVPK